MADNLALSEALNRKGNSVHKKSDIQPKLYAA
jgi:hypothetical protein